jgi:type II secretion system protein H
MKRMRRKPPSTRRRSAYTLVELVVVLLLLGIVAAAAGPKITNTLHRHRALAAARRIAADLEFARETARNASTAQSIQFDVGANSYTIPGLADPDRPSKSYQVSLARIGLEAQITKVDAGGDATLLIDGYGTPDSDARITVVAGKHSQTVVLNAATGRITLE